MKAWLVRFVSLYVFNVLVLLVVGWLLPGVRVGWAALWGGLILTAATIWLKPLITRLFRGMAATSAGRRTRLGEKLVQACLVFVVEAIVWVLVVLLSRVDVSGWFWGWVLPPIALLIAWAIYDAVDDRIEARAGALYDRATGRGAKAATSGGGAKAAGSAAGSTAADAPAAATGRRELKDGLTEEQRRMFDEL